MHGEGHERRPRFLRRAGQGRALQGEAVGQAGDGEPVRRGSATGAERRQVGEPGRADPQRLVGEVQRPGATRRPADVLVARCQRRGQDAVVDLREHRRPPGPPGCRRGPADERSVEPVHAAAGAFGRAPQVLDEPDPWVAGGEQPDGVGPAGRVGGTAEDLLVEVIDDRRRGGPDASVQLVGRVELEHQGGHRRADAQSRLPDRRPVRGRRSLEGLGVGGADLQVGGEVGAADQIGELGARHPAGELAGPERAERQRRAATREVPGQHGQVGVERRSGRGVGDGPSRLGLGTGLGEGEHGRQERERAEDHHHPGSSRDPSITRAEGPHSGARP